MPRKGENIYKRKDGRWEGRYIRSYDSEHKAKYAYVYGKTYSEVKRKLTEQRGNVQKVQPTKNKSSTYGELLDCWLHSMQLNTKESTQARYTHLIKTHIKPHLGAVQLSQLTTDAIEIFIEQQLTDGRLDNSGGLSPKTVTDILTIIKSTIEYARYKELPVICNLSKLSIKKKEKEMRVFTPSEQESLIGTLTNDMDHSKFGVLLSLYTEIRVGELCALQWEDFDLAHSKLKIRKTMQRIQDLGNGSVSKTKIVITEPKSQCSIREIPLPLFIVDVAKKFASNPKAYILTGTDRYIEPRTMQNRFKSYVKECNVEPANFHVLRHTFATRCVEVGFEVKSLSEVLGHANVNITLNRYVHSSFELKHSNMNKLASQYKPSNM
jgi:site-specific recombinase